MTTNVELSARAERDLRRIKRGADRQRLVVALQALAGDAANLDVKALQGRAGHRGVGSVSATTGCCTGRLSKGCGWNASSIGVTSTEP